MLLILLFAELCFAQEHPLAERIYLDLPPDTRSEDVYIRYKIDTDRGSEAYLVERKAGLHQYSFPVAASFAAKPKRAIAVIYSPGCQFKVYEFDVTGSANPHQSFRCDPLRTKHIEGTIALQDIPKNPHVKRDRSLNITAELTREWICDYFFSPISGEHGTVGGSCLGASVPLGVVGVLDPSTGGSFGFDIPDFTFDPTFKDFSSARYGIVALAIRDKITNRVLGVLRPIDRTEIEDNGLTVSGKYAEPIRFTTDVPR